MTYRQSMQTTAGLLFALVTLGAAPTLLAQDNPKKDEAVELRGVDRATVRIVAIFGVRPAAVERTDGGVRRFPAVPHTGHGSGVVVRSDGLILTAAHVTRGADALAVLVPGSDTPLPATLVYVHPDRDVAFLKVPGPIHPHLPVPGRTPRLHPSDHVSASGYPLDIRERYPAAVSGVLSRRNNDGSLQLAMGVNPGNSGGPVIDSRGQLIGILSRRGDPQAGVESIAFLEPVEFIREAYDRATRALDNGHAALSRDRAFAQIVADLVRTSDDKPVWEKTSLPVVDAASVSVKKPEHAAIVAALAWNMGLALLEEKRCASVEQLSPRDQERAQHLFKTAFTLAKQADAEAPTVRLRYSILRTILIRSK